MEKSVRVHHLQHVPFEGLGSMNEYFSAPSHQLSSTHLYMGQALPPLESFDWLIVMGGPMGVSDHAEFPWLEDARSFIRDAIDSGKTVLGICLGAQLIAAALGANVTRGRKEIGWFPIETTAGIRNTILSSVLPDTTLAFHWHADTFELPSGAELLASSDACINQAFSMSNRIFGFQFHLETTLESAQALISNCSQDLDGSQFVQTASEMIGDRQRFSQINGIMASALAAIEEHCS
jgi:GMP synthase-like glutamine amidotransferase|tara:strand:+ start:2394 stop:3101 length:708 start_codon:yes stop_codon:yes gene_type:complete